VVLAPPILALVLALAADGGAAPRPASPPLVRPATAPAAAVTAKRVAGKAPGAAKKAAPGAPARKVATRPAKIKRPPKPKVIELFQVNTKETLKLRLPIAGTQKRANHFFRCHHTQAQGRMHPRLLRLLFQIGQHWPGQRLEVVSGYRHPTVAKNPRSPHMKGFACDFRVVGVKNTDLRDYVRKALQHVGVGYYPNSSFVHLDVRQGPSAFWIDYSGPGENALYSDNASEDMRSGRAESFRPTKIDPSWAEREDDAPPPAVGAPGAAGQVTAKVPAAAAEGVPQVQ
jgi:uncharacterized protein YcbK (DUF882 family)